MVKGTTIATATNVDGTFQPEEYRLQTSRLSSSYVGYEAQQVSSKRRRVGDDHAACPRPSAWRASKLSPWGYGTRNANRSGLSPRSARGTACPRAVAEPQTLAGNLAGVVALQTSKSWAKTTPSSGSAVSPPFTGSPDPLILVDGIEASAQRCRPAEIESFSVLKDASATAVYGVRGANGVILLSTRAAVSTARPGSTCVTSRASFASKRLSFADAATRSGNVQRGGGCRECLGGTGNTAPTRSRPCACRPTPRSILMSTGRSLMKRCLFPRR